MPWLICQELFILTTPSKVSRARDREAPTSNKAIQTFFDYGKMAYEY